MTEATQAAQQAVELAQKKYQAGLTDFNNVLDAAALASCRFRNNWPKAREP